jgi:hypothetical protein
VSTISLLQLVQVQEMIPAINEIKETLVPLA